MSSMPFDAVIEIRAVTEQKMHFRRKREERTSWSQQLGYAGWELLGLS